MRSTTLTAVLLAACGMGSGAMAEITSVDGAFTIQINQTVGVDKSLVGPSAMYHISIEGSNGDKLFEIYKHVDVQQTLGPPTEKSTVVIAGRFPGDAKLTVTVSGADPAIGNAPAGINSYKTYTYVDHVAISDTDRPYAICANPLAVSGACDEEFTITRTFAADASTMQLSQWSTPACMLAAFDGGCAREEKIQMFEYVAPESMFITMLKMDATIPMIRKNSAGQVMHVDPWAVDVDLHEGTAAALEMAMAFPEEPFVSPIGGFGTDCRTYVMSASHGSTRGYRHSGEHVSHNQFVLDAPFKAIKGSTYTIRVKMTREVAPIACSAAGNTFSIGVLGRDAKTCRQQCDLNGYGDGSDCAKGCLAAHPLMLTDANLCSNVACCDGDCGAPSDFNANNKNCDNNNLVEAKIGCEYAADANQGENVNWLVGANRKCSTAGLSAQLDHSVVTGGDSHGVTFSPALQDSTTFEAGSTIAVSCVGQTPLEDASCDTYTCDRGTFVGSKNGKFELCSFQDHCLQGCLSSDLAALETQFLIGSDVKEVTVPEQCTDLASPKDCASVAVLQCNPKPQGASSADGAFEGSTAYECKLVDGEFTWEKWLGSGLGDGKCRYKPAVVTTAAPVTLDPNGDLDIDAYGNIVPRTTTTTTTTTTTVPDTPVVTTTSTTAVVLRQTLDFTFNNVDIDSFGSAIQFEFRSKVETLIEEHANNVVKREDMLFVTHTKDGANSVETVHFKETSEDPVYVSKSAAQIAKIADAINAYLLTATVTVQVRAENAFDTPTLATVSASTSMMTANYADLKQLDPLMLWEEDADDYDNDDDVDPGEPENSLTGGEKFGLAILVVLIIAMVFGIGRMAYRMQTDPKYKRRSAAYEEGQASIPLRTLELDPFAQSGSSTHGSSRPPARSIHAQRRQSALAASEQYAGQAAVRMQKLRQIGGASAGGETSADMSFKGGRPTGQQQVRNISGFGAQTSTKTDQAGVAHGAHRRTVQQRPIEPAGAQTQPMSRSITEDAAIGLEELEPAVFGNSFGQNSVRGASARPISMVAGQATNDGLDDLKPVAFSTQGAQQSVKGRPLSVIAGTAKQAKGVGAFSVGDTIADEP